MQALFEWDMCRFEDESIENVVDRLVFEFAPGLDDKSFVVKLIRGVIMKVEKLDLIIGKAAPDWPIQQIAVVDRNILRLGLYELLFGNRTEVPARVAINESIELAKTFGGENSGRFVNGVLGAVYKEMGEPGKYEIPAKRRRPADVPYEKMPIEKLAGTVVYTFEAGKIKLALVYDIFGYWTLCKGHVEMGEDLKTCAAREAKEELGLSVQVEDELGSNEYIASDPELGKIRKQVTYFLAQAPAGSQVVLGEDKSGLVEAGWFELPEIPDLKMYDDIMPMITKAVTILKNKDV